jgi:hypothetical protein
MTLDVERVNGREREMSLGPFPELSLTEARSKHAAARKAVIVDGADPLADKHAAKAAVAAKGAAPTFGAIADAYLRAHETAWRNPKHRQQWAMTLREYAAPIRDLPVDQVDANAVRRVLEPIWNKTPETASRLRARIEAVLAAAQVAGHIDADRPNPARSTRCCRSRRSSARAAITQPCATRNWPPSWRSSPRPKAPPPARSPSRSSRLRAQAKRSARHGTRSTSKPPRGSSRLRA